MEYIKQAMYHAIAHCPEPDPNQIQDTWLNRMSIN